MLWAEKLPVSDQIVVKLFLIFEVPYICFVALGFPLYFICFSQT